MQKPVMHILARIIAVGGVLLWGGMAASGDFSPVKIVNSQAISGYELSQRIAFLEVLKQPGDIRNEAMNGLIEDRLRNAAAKAAGVQLTPDEIMAGMTEFAARANLSAEEFVKAIGEAGIAPETFRDFVTSGLVWRQVVQKKYEGQITISEAAVDRALAQFSIPVAQRVTLAEIVLPATGAGRNAALAAARELRIDLMRGRDFAEAARAVSIGATAGRGGTLAPQNLSQLPDDQAAAVRVLNVGQLSNPVIFDDKVVIYKMIASAQEPTTITSATELDYAEYLVPNTTDGAKRAELLRRKVDNCDDLYTLAKGQPPEILQRRTVPIGGAPAEVAAALTMMDAGEISTNITRGPWRVLLMLCNRGAPAGSQASRDEVRLILTNQRLASLAAVYLEELRSDAVILDP